MDVKSGIICLDDDVCVCVCVCVCLSERLTDHSLPDRAPSVACCTLDRPGEPTRRQPSPNSNADGRPTGMVEGWTERDDLTGGQIKVALFPTCFFLP